MRIFSVEFWSKACFFVVFMMVTMGVCKREGNCMMIYDWTEGGPFSNTTHTISGVIKLDDSADPVNVVTSDIKFFSFSAENNTTGETDSVTWETDFSADYHAIPPVNSYTSMLRDLSPLLTSGPPTNNDRSWRMLLTKDTTQVSLTDQTGSGRSNRYSQTLIQVPSTHPPSTSSLV